MINKEFLKKIDILYVEDDDVAREKLGAVLKRLFKNVHLAANGMEGFLTFQKQLTNNTPVDLILSDINMPKMSGVELLEQIREVDKKIPFIFTTARSESEHLLRAIELKANHYILKPIDIDDIILKAQETCQEIYYEKIIEAKNEEVKEYLDTIENIALVLKIDKEGNILHLNSAFLEELHMELETAKNKNFFELIHPDIAQQSCENIKTAMENTNSYKEDLKFINASNEAFYANCNIFKTDSEEETHFMLIGFLNTKEKLEKREFKKKVLKTMQERNIKESEAKQEIEELQTKIEKYEKVVNLQKEEIISLKNKNKLKIQQIEHYEKELLIVDEKHEKTLQKKNEQVKEYKDALVKILDKKGTLIKTNQDQEKQLVEKAKDLNDKEQLVKEQGQKIEELTSTLSITQEKLKEKEEQVKILIK